VEPGVAEPEVRQRIAAGSHGRMRGAVGAEALGAAQRPADTLPRRQV
jgi:hypothetical protein